MSRVVETGAMGAMGAMDGVAVQEARIGRGLFARRAFRRNERILQIDGRIVRHEVLWKRGGVFADNCYRFGPETYLDPGDGPSRFINHSCEPTAAVGKTRNRLFLFAAIPIGRGREITFDYSTILGGDDIWTMRCKCGAASCRRTIRNFASLPEAVQERYLENDFVPKFIINTL